MKAKATKTTAEPRKHRTAKPAVEQKPEAAPKLRKGFLYEPTALKFRTGTTQFTIAETLSDGKQHAIAELQDICAKDKRLNFGCVGFTTARLRGAGFTITKAEGQIQVTKEK